MKFQVTIFALGQMVLNEKYFHNISQGTIEI